MRLLRLVTVYFTPIPAQIRSIDATVGNVQIRTLGAYDVEKSLRLLLVADSQLGQRPELTKNGLIALPDTPRRAAEAALETLVNVIAVSKQCRRSLASPIPCFALVPEDAQSEQWLRSAKGFVVNSTASVGAKFDIDVTQPDLLKNLTDRLDGAALLAEALAHTHPTGEFHELIRLG